MAFSAPSPSLTDKLKIEQEPDSPERHIGNEGLTKRVLRKGLAWQTPGPGDEIEGS